MISSIFRLARCALPEFESTGARAVRISFQAPLLPTASTSLNRRKIAPVHLQPCRRMGIWPLSTEGGDSAPKKCYRHVKKEFIVQNLNFSLGKETEMREILRFLKSSNVETIKLDRGSVIGYGDWVNELLTYLAKTGAKEVDIVARSEMFKIRGQFELVQPSSRRVQREAACLRELHQRPEELRISKINLTKQMINVLADLLSASSHGVKFDLIVRR